MEALVLAVPLGREHSPLQSVDTGQDLQVLGAGRLPAAGRAPWHGFKAAEDLAGDPAYIQCGDVH